MDGQRVPRSIGYQLCLQRGPKNLASAGTVVHAVHRLQGLLQNTWTSLDGQIIITVPTSIINKGIATSKASLLVTRASMPLLWTPTATPLPRSAPSPPTASALASPGIRWRRRPSSAEVHGPGDQHILSTHRSTGASGGSFHL